MTPPPIRYPLPTLILLIVLGLLAWRGAEWTRAWRSTLSARWAKLAEGPPVPSSTEPQVVAGPIRRRVLLLHDDTPASATPGGSTVETIRFRGFADIYDVWPLKGEPTHYRIGNRRPIGWVVAGRVLPWNTRLVVRLPKGSLALGDSPTGARSMVEIGEAPLPVIGWTETAVEVAVWEPGRPWSEVARRGWISATDIPTESWGVLLSRDELLSLLGRAVKPEAAAGARLRAILGKPGEDLTLSEADQAAVRSALPRAIQAIPSPRPRDAAEALARVNEEWTPDAEWAGLSFRAVPLSILP